MDVSLSSITFNCWYICFVWRCHASPAKNSWDVIYLNGTASWLFSNSMFSYQFSHNTNIVPLASRCIDSYTYAPLKLWLPFLLSTKRVAISSLGSTLAPFLQQASRRHLQITASGFIGILVTNLSSFGNVACTGHKVNDTTVMLHCSAGSMP